MRIHADAIERYLRRSGYPDARIDDVVGLGRDPDQAEKAYGYGCPWKVQFSSRGQRHEVVLRTMSANPFGHDRRSDRLCGLLLAFDTFGQIPRHIEAHDVGIVDEDGELRSIPRGEPFLVTSFVPGTLYADDLHGLPDTASDRDLARAESLARYLRDLHAAPADPATYVRSLRDTFGHGEGILGLCDSYPATDPVATPARLLRLQQAALELHWQFKQRGERARRTHGDFHPFNILFTADNSLAVLDCSRGAAGDPADDVTCLSINYLFFALLQSGSFSGAYRDIWNRFWATYLDGQPDPELLAIAPLFFAWRALVLASPLWYPDVDRGLRDLILQFAERLLEGVPFVPERVDEVLR